MKQTKPQNDNKSYQEVVEEILEGGKLTEELALKIYALGPDAVVFALLALGAKNHTNGDQSLSRPSATIPAYEKLNKKSKRKKKPGRKEGFKGTSRVKPDRVDKEVCHTLDTCPECGGEVNPEQTPRVRYVEDLQENSKSEVTEHKIYRAWCPQCSKKVEPVVDEALPNSQIGLRLMVFTAWLHYALGTTISQVMAVLNHHLCIQLTGGALASAWHRLAGILQPWYEKIGADIKEGKIVHCDETGWRVDGRTHWVWCFSNKKKTYFMIERTRGSPALLKFFTDAFEGVLVTDFWGAYSKVTALARQMCLGHLLRELSSTSKYKSPSGDWPKFEKSLNRLLRDSVRLWYRKDTYTPHQYDSRSKRLSLRLRLIIEHDWRDPHCKRLVKRLVRHEDHLFTFVSTDGVPFDNNHSEREIRGAVVMRKNSYGNRSLQGAKTQAVLMSIFRTLGKTGLNPINEIVGALKAYVSTGKLPPMKD